MDAATLLARLAGAPGALLDEAEQPGFLGRVAPILLAFAAAGGALFGAAVGAFHEGPQWLYAAIKMPAVLLVPALLVLPAARTLAELLDLPLSSRRASVAALAAAARVGILAATLAPVVWLIGEWDGRYRAAMLVTVACTALAGLGGLRVWLAAVPHAGAWRAWGLAVAAAVFALSSQSAWLLRPFVLRPHLPVVFLQAPDGDVLTTLSMRAQGPPRVLQAQVRAFKAGLGSAELLSAGVPAATRAEAGSGLSRLRIRARVEGQADDRTVAAAGAAGMVDLAADAAAPTPTTPAATVPEVPADLDRQLKALGYVDGTLK